MVGENHPLTVLFQGLGIQMPTTLRWAGQSA